MNSAPFVHKQALIENGVTLGSRSRVWAFAHLLGGAILGEDCNVCDHTFIEGKVRIGNRVTIKSGVYLWDGLVLEDDVFVGPAAVFTNDLRPRSKRFLPEYPTTLLRQGCSIGAGAVILPGLTIGRYAMIGAGSVVTHSVPDFALVVGNPARFQAWLCRCGEKLVHRSDQGLACICGKRFELRTDKTLEEVQ